MTDVIGEIRAELVRLGVTYPTVSRVDEITVTDHGAETLPCPVPPEASTSTRPRRQP